MQQFMENVRQLWQRLSSGARDTGQSAGAYLERQRKVVSLRGDVRNAKGQRSKLYNVMGRKVYALHLKGKVENKDLLRSCHEVDELNTLIEAKQTQIDALLAAPEEEDVAIEDDRGIPEEEGAVEEGEEPEEEPEEPSPADDKTAKRE